MTEEKRKKNYERNDLFIQLVPASIRSVFVSDIIGVYLCVCAGVETFYSSPLFLHACLFVIHLIDVSCMFAWLPYALIADIVVVIVIIIVIVGGMPISNSLLILNMYIFISFHFVLYFVDLSTKSGIQWMGCNVCSISPSTSNQNS